MQHAKKHNQFFYDEIRKTLYDIDEVFTATYFNLNDYKKIIINSNKVDDKKIIAIYKILSPAHLQKLPFANDQQQPQQRFLYRITLYNGFGESKCRQKT